jgi:hypothetical protein
MEDGIDVSTVCCVVGPLLLMTLDGSFGRCCSWRLVRLVRVTSEGGDDVCNLTWS